MELDFITSVDYPNILTSRIKRIEETSTLYNVVSYIYMEKKIFIFLEMEYFITICFSQISMWVFNRRM